MLTQKLRDQDRASTHFFAGRARFPKSRRSGACQSIRLQLDQRQVHRLFDADAGLLKVPKLGRLNVRWTDRPPKVEPKMVTLSRDPAGRYFLSMSVAEDIRQPEAADQSAGVDFGLANLVVTSRGERIGNLRPLARKQARLRRAQKALPRRRRGSERWQAQRR